MKDHFECPICTMVSIDPVQLPCQCPTVFCRGHLQTALERKSECPTCRAPARRRQIASLPTLLQNMYNAMAVRCGVDERCKAKITIERVKHHERHECRFVQVCCENSGCPYAKSESGLLRRDLSKHMRKCKYSSVQCEDCHRVMRRMDLGLHQGKSACTDPDFRLCPHAEVECSACQQTCKHSDMPSHVLNDCPEGVIACACPGCSHTCERKHMPEHTLSPTHIPLLLQQVETLHRQHADVLQRFQQLEARSRQQQRDAFHSNNSVLLEFNGFESRRRAAVAKRKWSYVTMRSDVKHFSLPAYHFSVVVSLTGASSATAGSMSLLYEIRKGRYDSLLQWPFNRQLTVELFRQGGYGGGKKHVMNSEDARQAWTDCGRPGNKPRMNSHGCDEFIRYQTLLGGRYLDDGTLYVKVTLGEVLPPPQMQ
jgi:hypothetical protein